VGLAGRDTGRRGDDTAPQRELKVLLAGRLAGMLLKTKSGSQRQDLGWK